MPNILDKFAYSAALAMLIVIVSIDPGSAGDSAAKLAQPAREAAAPPLLVHFPANRQDLEFDGESASHSWSVYIRPTEAAHITSLQLGLLNTISVLPDRSTLAVTINGKPVGEVHADSSRTVSTKSIAIPPGLMVPGFNSITIKSKLVHRVDCSIEATHELWAVLKPAMTGFVVTSGAAAEIGSIEDLAGEKTAEDGTTNLHVRMEEGARAADIDRAAGFIRALVERAQILRPIIDVGPAQGTGPGFDIVVGRTEALKTAGITLPPEITRIDGVSIGRTAPQKRLVVSLSASDDRSLDAALAAFQDRSSQSQPLASLGAVDLRQQQAGLTVDPEKLMSFDALGLDEVNVIGRRFVGSFNIALPDDAYLGSSARVHLYLDGSRSADLTEDSSITIRVNDKVASFSNIGSGFPEVFRQHRIDLPLDVFHAGRNEIEIEALTPSKLDATCDTEQMADGLRLHLAGTSRIEFPHIARLEVTPEIAGHLRIGSIPLDIYLPDASRGFVAAGLTVVATLAAEKDRRIRGQLTEPDAGVTFHLAMPAPTDPFGLVIAPFDSLPDHILKPLTRIVDRPKPSDPHFEDKNFGLRLRNIDSNDENKPSKISIMWDAWTNQSQKAIGIGIDKIRQWHFFFGGLDANPPNLPATNETLTVAAIEPGQLPQAFLGVALPRFDTASRQWIVLAAQNKTTINLGLQHLVASDAWKRLAGQAVTASLDTSELRIRPATEQTLVLPKTLPLGEIRSIVGGVISKNIILSGISLLLLINIFGISMHMVIKRFGEGKQ